MNKYKNYFVNQNKWYLFTCFILFDFMFTPDLFFNYLCFIGIMFLSFSRSTDFDFLKRSTNDENTDILTLKKLLPIDLKQYNKMNIINSSMWCLLLFCASLIFVYKNGQVNSSNLMIITIINFSICILPLLLELYEMKFQQTFTMRAFLLSFSMLFLSILSIAAMRENITVSLPKYFSLYIGFLCFIIFFGVISKYFIKNSPVSEKASKGIFSIHEISNYTFGKPQHDFFPLIVGFIYVFESTPEFYIFIHLVIAFSLSKLDIERYFEKQTYLRLLPISTEKKKLSCHVTTILQRVGICFVLFIIQIVLNPNLYNGIILSLKEFIIALTLHILVYSCYNFYYHKHKNMFYMLIGIILELSYSIIYVFNNKYFLLEYNFIYLIVPTLIISGLSLLIDYNRKPLS